MVLHIRSAPEPRDPPPTAIDKLYVRRRPAGPRRSGRGRRGALGAAGRCPRLHPRPGAAARVRMWLEGARLPDGGTVHVRMATWGNFLHRSGGSSYQFTSRPLVRDFRYRVRRADDGSAALGVPERHVRLHRGGRRDRRRARVRVHPADPLRRVARGGHRRRSGSVRSHPRGDAVRRLGQPADLSRYVGPPCVGGARGPAGRRIE